MGSQRAERNLVTEEWWKQKDNYWIEGKCYVFLSKFEMQRVYLITYKMEKMLSFHLIFYLWQENDHKWGDNIEIKIFCIVFSQAS